MGFYLNSKSPYRLFCDDYFSTYFVDKTEILKNLVPFVELEENTVENFGSNQGKGYKYVCITRPRRFGKTVMANMLSSYFGRGVDSSKVFCNLKVSSCDWYERHLNKHNVIHIMFNKLPDECTTYTQYINRIKRKLLGDLRYAYPEVEIEKDDSVWDALRNIFEYNDERFIFIFDEWDFIYHQDFILDADKKSFTQFVSNMLKDEPYVELAYMTGILPIAKYSSGSELNMFCEYTMAAEEMFSDAFGFTDSEVDVLFKKYQAQMWENENVTRDGLRIWYDGYHTKSGERVYNPRSVVMALTNNNMGNYWTSSGPYDELFYYIGANVDAVKNDVGLMIADIPVPAKVREYAATSMELKTRDEIFSAMVVYGFLNYEDGCVSIPNKELMGKFAYMVQKEPALGNVYKLTKESGRMLKATLAGDIKTMVEIMEYAHHVMSPMGVYSDEAELASVLRWVYLQAIDYYEISREDKAGVGYVDYIFYPYRHDDDGIIIELKVGDTADKAIQQIKDRQYALNFENRLGEGVKYTGRVLAVGIAYDKNDENKRHECKVEVLREKLPTSIDC